MNALRLPRQIPQFLLGLGFLLCLGALARPLFLGRVDRFDDLGRFHLPLRDFYSRCLAAGDRFDWCPELLGGFYVQGEGQAGMYHPLHLLLYRVLPLSAAFELEIIASYPFALAGVWLLLRRWKLPPVAAGLAAITFSFAGFNLFHYAHMNAVAVVAHLPWLLLMLDQAIRVDDPRRAAWARLGVGLLTASQILLAYPQYVGFTALVEILYVVYVRSTQHTLSLRRCAGWTLAKAVGGLIGAIQLMPTVDLLGHSGRATPPAWLVAFGSLPAANLTQIVAPYLFQARVATPRMIVGDWMDQAPAQSILDWRVKEFGLYNGAVVPVLVLWLMLRWRSLGGPRRRLAVGALILAALGLILALGENTPVFAVYRRLPLASVFRLPARFVVLYHLATAVLLAIALTDLIRVARSGRPLAWRWLWPLAMPAVAGLMLVLAPARCLPASLQAEPLAALRTALIGPLFLGTMGVAAVLAGRGWRQAPVLLIGLAVLDVGYYEFSYLHQTRAGAWSQKDDAVPPATLPRGSILAVQEPFYSNAPIAMGLRTVGGYAALAPTRLLNYHSKAVRFAAGATAAWDPARPSEIKVLPAPLPRVRLVTRARTSANLNGGTPGPFPTLDLERIDLATEAITPDAPRLGLVGSGPVGTAAILRDRPGSITVITDAPARQLLVLAESFYPGWHARVDGHRVAALQVNGDFLGCVVAPGRHRVSWRFEPASLRTGGWLTALGFLLLVASHIVSLRGAGRLTRSDSSGSGRVHRGTSPFHLRRRSNRGRTQRTPHQSTTPQITQLDDSTGSP